MPFSFRIHLITIASLEEFIFLNLLEFFLYLFMYICFIYIFYNFVGLPSMQSGCCAGFGVTKIDKLAQKAN